MRVENSPNRFILFPAISVLIFDICVTAIVLAMVLSSPIIILAKIVTTGLLVGYGIITVHRFNPTVYTELQYLPSTNQWLRNGDYVSLRKQQFVTRHLLVLYFKTEQGEKISQVIPRDALPKKQHIRLRKLIIAWSRTSNRGG